MRTRVVWLAAILLIGFLGFCPPSQAQEPPNLLTNSGFENGASAPWNIWGGSSFEVVTTLAGAAVPEPPIEGKYCLHVTVPNATANFWDTAMGRAPGTFQKGKKYTLSVWFKSKSGTAQVHLKPELGQDPWTGYGAQTITMTDKWAEYSITTPEFTQDVSPTSITMHVGFAKQEFWMDAVRWYEGDYAPPAFLKNYKARSPSPAVAATDVPRDAVLSWQAGPFAATHDIYFGTTFADVNNAAVANAVSKAQADTTFDPAGLLAYNTTYFWRIDEVNAAPDKAVFKGDTWSFTTEPYTYWITGVTATASSSAPNMGPEKTVNGSGLANGLHSSVDTDMWLSAPATQLPAWIRFAFDRAYVLDAMTVWNSNQKVELYVGFGAKAVTVEYSLDGTAWTTLGDVEIARATGADGYAGAVIDLGGVTARYVRLTITSTWGGFIPQTGLSEVRFSYIPVVARQPAPAVDAVGVPLDTVLDWRDGRQAASHKLYLSTDKQAVVDGTTPVATTTESRHVASGLQFGTPYFWRVDEVNDAPASSWQGDVWNFSTTEYIVIDDFESYNDDEGQGTRIYETWIDGWTNDNGSTVGNWEPPFAEQDIVHDGSQSMPMDYNNINSPFYSEAVRTWSAPQDWTVSGATDVSLWFQGAAVGFAESATGTITLSASGTDIWNNADQFRFAYKRLAANGSITARVDSLVRTDGWAKAGVMIRETLDAGSKHAAVVVTPDNGVSFPWRMFANDVSDQINQTGVAAPRWVRLTRTGNTLKAEHSADGKTWTSVGTDAAASSKDIAMTGTVYIGLALTSHNAGSVTTAEFSNVSVTGATGSWLAAEIGADHPGNDPDQLYVTVEDSTGKKATVTHPDPKATILTTWTQWRIPLNDFTGVNMAKVKKMSIGVGNHSQPTAAGAGKIYIDDVQYGHYILPVGLVAHYALENDTQDSSGNEHHGTVVGSTSFVAGPAGKGQGMLFPGTVGNFVDLGTYNPSVMSRMLSVSLWAKWNGLTTYYQGLIAKRDSWAADQMMWQVEANVTTGALTFSRTGVYPGSGNPVLPVGEWTHVAVTFDKATARFYINGAQTGQGAFSFGSDQEAGLHFGCCDSNGGNPFNGALDEVRLYDIVLTPAEVAALAGK